MTTVNLVDSITIADGTMRRTKDGYLAATARVARGENVQKYLGSEMGKPELRTVDVYRPDSEVFNKDAMHSFAHRPLTNNHPPEPVTADNWNKYARGYTGDRIARDGEYIQVPLLMTDSDTINAMEDGKREMSVGYQAEIEWQDGITPSGLHYDAIQRNIRANHIALVDRARAGHGARIGDSDAPQPAATTQEKPNMADNQTVVVDGVSIESTKQGAEVINKLQGLLADARTELTDAQTVSDEALAAKDAELAAKDAKIAELEKAKLSDADMDKAVAERAQLIAQAKSIKDGEYKGSPAEIKKAAVVAVLGDEAIKDKSEAYVDARFDILAEDAAKADPVKKALADGKPANVNDDGQAEYEARIYGSWKQEKANG